MFPPVEMASRDGLLCWGGDYAPETLLLAYRSGIFPWPTDEIPHPLWFAPPRRSILPLDEFHASHSTRKLLRKAPWTVRFNSDFAAVLRGCAAPRRAPCAERAQDIEEEAGTWLVPGLIDGLQALHAAGHAHSVEVYEAGADGEELVGGLYGIALGGYFCGESMFHRRTGASKYALCHLVEHLRERGAGWIDCQQQTPLFASFGARLIPRRAFMKKLALARDLDVRLFDS
jgi:leucyl/phenylalanyl-tRNA--protein transferase